MSAEHKTDHVCYVAASVARAIDIVIIIISVGTI